MSRRELVTSPSFTAAVEKLRREMETGNKTVSGSSCQVIGGSRVTREGQHERESIRVRKINESAS